MAAIILPGEDVPAESLDRRRFRRSESGLWIPAWAFDLSPGFGLTSVSPPRTASVVLGVGGVWTLTLRIYCV